MRRRDLVPLAVAALLTVGCSAAPTPQPALSGPPSAGTATGLPGPPTAVRIPAIGIDTAPIPLGVAADGTAEVPADYARVGWFAGGGRSAATVLLGHVDSRSGPAVFHRLRDLAAGDRVEIERGGQRAVYAVERVEQVAKDAFPTFAVFGATGEDVVRLVTCAGAFDRGARSYTDNLVVHAVRTG